MKQSNLFIFFVISIVFLATAVAGQIDSVSGFSVVKTIEVGKAPHGIRFNKRGTRALIALSGEDKIAVLDLIQMKVLTKFDAGKTPLDLISMGSDGRWAVTQFRGESLKGIGIEGSWPVAKGPSLFSPEVIDGKAFVVSEFGDKLSVFDLEKGKIVETFPTGKRPYPADVTRDGVLAFVPNMTDGTVSVIDLLNKKTLATTPVCSNPRGGALTRDDVAYVVACNGSDELAFINTASFKVIHKVKKGVGKKPFSVAMTPDGQYGLVNNAGGDTVSILDIEERKIVGAIKVGKQPVVVRFHPNGRQAFVANEIDGTVSIIDLNRPTLKRRSGTKKNEVIVLGMIHSGHRISKIYGLEMLRTWIRRIGPDYVLVELPPNRFKEAVRGFKTEGVLSEPRAKLFPEYVDVLFPLMKEMDFSIIPTAGWTSPMNQFRRKVLQDIPKDPGRKKDWAEYQEAIRRSSEAHEAGGAPDDPRWIHTDEYDAAINLRYQVYNRLFNEEIGPGGWDNINAAHYANIAKALDKHTGEGKRFLITYGSAHKGWFLRKLRKRKDIELINPVRFLK